MTDQPQQQIRKSTPEEDIRELFSRVAKLNDIASALLAPEWGSEAGIIPTGHPLHPTQQFATLEVVRDEQTPGAIHELAAAVRDLTSAIRLEIADSQPDDLTGARTTPDNPATSSDTADNPLRGVLARAIELADEHSCQMQDGPDYRALAAAVVAELQPGVSITAALARTAAADIQRVTTLYERWVKAGPPPIGTPAARWWDQRLAELRNAILPTDQPASDNGPSVAECAKDDRRWPLQKTGE
ncbi:hypothetical protein ABZZ74_23495 [Streptomyces sp. NPDC006476]|uniref:hypothetical protein n=1 Tax=Streptomyces sp. NPDC006476 TaxID=3157175 RepID=UPI0033BDFD08